MAGICTVHHKITMSEAEERMILELATVDQLEISLCSCSVRSGASKLPFKIKSGVLQGRVLHITQACVLLAKHRAKLKGWSEEILEDRF